MDSTIESNELDPFVGTSPWDHQCHPVPLPSLNRSITSIDPSSESLTSSTPHYNNVGGAPVLAPSLEQRLPPLLQSSPDSSVPVSAPPLEQQLHPLLLPSTYTSSSSNPDDYTVADYAQCNELQWNDDEDILRKWRINRRLEEARQAVKSIAYSILPISTSSTDRATVDSDCIKPRSALRDLSEFRQSGSDNSRLHTCTAATRISGQYHPHHCYTKPHRHCSTSFINERYYSSIDTDNPADLKEQCDPLTNATAIGNRDSSTITRQRSGYCCHSYCCCYYHQCTCSTHHSTSVPVTDANRITTTSDCCNRPSPCCISKQCCPTNTPSSTNDCLVTTSKLHQSNATNSLQQQQQYLDYHLGEGEHEHPADNTISIIEDDGGRSNSETELLRDEETECGHHQTHVDIKQQTSLNSKTSLNSTTATVATTSLMDELVTQVVCDNLFKFTSNS